MSEGIFSGFHHLSFWQDMKLSFLQKKENSIFFEKESYFFSIFFVTHPWSLVGDFVSWLLSFPLVHFYALSIGLVKYIRNHVCFHVDTIVFCFVES